MAGGGPLLTDVVDHRPDRHTADNAAALVAAAFAGRSPGRSSRRGSARGRAPGRLSARPARRRAARRPRPRRSTTRATSSSTPAAGAPSSSGISIASPRRRRGSPARLGAAVVLTGAPAMPRCRRRCSAALPADIARPRPDRPPRSARPRRRARGRAPRHDRRHRPDAPRRGGGAPIVAVFGPSMPVRYAPRSTPHRVVRIDLPCAPCNMHPQAARALPGPHARLPGRRHRRRGHRRCAVARGRDRTGARPRAGDARVIGRLAIERAGRLETLDLDDYGAGAIADEAAGRANAWIKSLRHVEVAGRPLRDRFHYRGDSLWWFAELFLHKEGVLDALWRTALTLDAICEVEEPARVGIVDGGAALRLLLPQVAARLGIDLAAGHRRRTRRRPRPRHLDRDQEPRADLGRGGAAAAARATSGARHRRHAGVRPQRVLARRDRRGGLHRAGPGRARGDRRRADPAGRRRTAPQLPGPALVASADAGLAPAAR